MLTLQALSPAAQAASSPNVFISEVSWAGSSASQADEWIELYNADSQSVDLGGWILTGSASAGDALMLEDGTTLESGGVLLIANYEMGHENTTLDIEPDLTTAALSLSNSTLEILLTEPDGTVVDRVGDGGAPTFGSTSPMASMERDLETLEWVSATTSENLTNSEQLGTPGIVEVPVADVVTIDPCTTHEEAADEIVENEDETPSEESGPTPETTEPTDEPEEIETPVISYKPQDLLINEFVSDPVDGVEWVELLNTTDEDIDLNGWVLREGSDKETSLGEGLLEAGAFLIIENPAGNLNNSGDSILIFDASGLLIDGLTYGDDPPAPSKGKSLALDDEGEWQITTILTPGETNDFPNPILDEASYEEVDEEEAEPGTDSETESKNVSNAEPASEEPDSNVSNQSEIHQVVAVAVSAEPEEKTEATSTEVTSSMDMIRGVLTATPGTFGSQVAFLQGLQLYFYHGDWPDLSIGDVVEVVGERSVAREEERIKISAQSDIEIVDSVELEPYELTVEEVLVAEPGTLAQVKGNVLERDGDKLLLSDETGELNVVAASQTNVSWAGLSSYTLEVTGVVRTLGGEVRLYPRSQSDILFVEPPGPDDDAVFVGTVKEKDGGTPWLGLGLTAATVTALVYWIAKHRSGLKKKTASFATRLNLPSLSKF